MRTAVKNRVHALLARQGILPEHTDLFGKAGREFLAGLELPDGSAPAAGQPDVADR